MPGFEVYDEKEQQAVNAIFEEGGILFAHGFDKLRKNFHVREFEDELNFYFGSKYCSAVCSGTAGIKCALKAVGIKPGMEVITQPFNFIATVEAILDCGAIPRLCKINNNLNIDCESLERLINENTGAIIPVHMLGILGDIEDLYKIKTKYEIPIIEDNCEAIGSMYKDKYAGNLFDIGVFSFDHGKMIACGEGGAVLTNSQEINQFISSYSDHGHELVPDIPRGIDKAIIPGFNYRMTEMQAAVGKVQLKKLKNMIYLNKIRYEILQKKLSPKYYVRSLPKHTTSSYDTFLFKVDDFKIREKIINILKNKGIGTKNVPDAIRWHCSYFWNHFPDLKDQENSKDCYELLKKYIAIPIWLRIGPNIYEELADQIKSI